jgi:hypothetical protein
MLREICTPYEFSPLGGTFRLGPVGDSQDLAVPPREVHRCTRSVLAAPPAGA